MSQQEDIVINKNDNNTDSNPEESDKDNCNITNNDTETSNDSLVTNSNSIPSASQTPTSPTNSNNIDSGSNANNPDGSTPKTPDSDCFTQPLPPSHLPNLRSSSNHSSTSSTRTLDAEGHLNLKPEKVKSRWRRNSELESGHGTDHHGYANHSSQSPSSSSTSSSNNIAHETTKNSPLAPLNTNIPKETEPVPHYDHIDENIYLFERKKSKCKKEMRRMVCNCILTKEERQRGVLGCLDDCLNRMLMIECGNRCLLGDHCANKRFQKKQFAKVEPFKTVKKGWGLRAMQVIQPGQFIVEYVGEVLDPKEFKNRVKKYSKENKEHHYFMALKSDEIIDATIKGNLTRFINHSCDPNGETQKWTVNGELRIGFFATKLIEAGEEITFDYQFQRYGKKAQKCYCEAPCCRGFIGSTNDTDINIDGSLITPKQRSLEKTGEEEKSLEEEFEDLGLDEEIAKLTASGGIRNRQQTLMLARLMVRAEDTPNRTKLLEVLKGTLEIAYLRLFLDYHGLQLLWSWMADLEDVYLKGEILEVLAILPIPNKTVLKDSKVLDVVERWSKQAASEASQRKNGVSSVNAQLPLIVEPSTISSSSLPSTVIVKTEDKRDEQSVKVKEQQQQNEDQKPKKLEASDEVKKEDKDTPTESIEKPVKKEINSQSKEEIVNQNEIVDTKVDSNTEIVPEPMDEVKDTPVVDVQVEIELGCEVEIKQDINGVDTEIPSSENQSASSTPGDSTPGKPEPVRVRETRSSSTSSSTSTTDASSTASNLPVVAERIIGRRVSLKSRNESKDEGSKENKVTKEIVKPVPDIVMLTSKLLYLWKDLKEVFRIPRLERQKRLEDEKEADRKAIEEQERKAKGLPVVYDPKIKRGIDNRDNTIAGILGLQGLRKKSAKRPADDKKQVQNNLNSSSPASNTTGNTVNPENNSGPTPPKVNKEVHRMQFEMELMRKQYSQALEKYNEQIRQYESQMQMLQHQHLAGQPPGLHPSAPQPPNFDSNHLHSSSLSHHSPFKSGILFNSPNLMSLPPPVPPTLGMFSDPSNPFSGYGVNSEYSSNSGLATPVTPVAPLTPLTPSNDYHQAQPYNLESHHPNHINTSTTTSQHFSLSHSSKLEDQLRSEENQIDSDSQSINATSVCNQSSNLSSFINPVLIECTNSLNHTLMSDEEAVISTDYGVEYVPVKKSKKSSFTTSSSSSSSTTTPSGTTTTTTSLRKENNSRNNNSSSINCNISSSCNNCNDSLETLFNSVYPAPGTYYLTPDNCYFVPPPFDLHGHQIEPIVFENVPRPFSPSFTKESIQTALPPNWCCSKDKQGNVYYYNRVTKMVQWDLPEVNLIFESEKQATPKKVETEVATSNTSQDETIVQPEPSTLEKSNQQQQTPSEVQSSQDPSSIADKTEACTDKPTVTNNPETTSENEVQNSNDGGTLAPQSSRGTTPQASSEEQVVNGETKTPDNVTANEDSTSECMGTPSHTLPGSYEPDPRKRRSSTNSTGTHHNSTINNSNNSIVRNFSSLMEINDGDLIASNRRDRSDKSERRIKEKFKAEMSEHIKYCLNPYRKIDCRVGRILCNEDFKYVARRLTHFVMLKELRHCRNTEDLCCSETVKHKAKEYVKKYMANKGPIYRPESNEEICKDKEKCSPNS